MFAFLKSLGPQAPVAWHRGASVCCREFVSDVRRFAVRLPDQGTPINLCVDRYAFTVAWMAALRRGQTSLMPQNPLPATLQQLQESHPDSYFLCDGRGLDETLASRLARPVFAVTLGGPGEPDPWETSDPQIDPERPAVCLLTSGSTDRPQPHVKSWRILLDSAQVAAQCIAEALGWSSLVGLNLLATVPPQHSYGLESSVLLSLAAGAVLHGDRPFFPADIVEALSRLPRPRALVTTPLHLNHLLRSGLTLPVVDLVLCATAPLSLPLAQQAERLLGGPLVEIYGCTEAGQVATRRTVHGERWAAMGELTFGRSQTEGDETFFVQGGHLDRVWPLADTLQLVDARHFYLRGRANDLINVAGKRNSLSHLNMQLQRIDGVEDGCFWLPDERPDDVVRPVVFVVAPDLTGEQVIAGLRQRVESAFVPRRVVHVAALPRESTGKMTAQALRDFALKTLGEGA